jgi:hypothetical protein
MVLHRDLAQKVSPLTVGDELFRARAYEAATQRYGEFIDAHPRDRLAPLARLRQAQCRARQGEADADRLLADFIAAYPEHESVPVALVERWELARDAKRDDDAQRFLAQLERYPGHPILHTVIARMEHELEDAVHRPQSPATYNGPFLVHDDEIVRDHARRIIAQAGRFRISPTSPDFDGRVALVTQLCGHPDWGYALVSPQSLQAGQLLHTMARFDEVRERFGRFPALVQDALYYSGRHDDELIAAKSPSRFQILLQRGDADGAHEVARTDDERAIALMVAGRFDDALRLATPRGAVWSEALYELGRYQEVLDSTDKGWQARALARLGRFDEATNLIAEVQTSYLVALLRRRVGQVRESDAMIADIEQNAVFALSTQGEWFPRFIMPAVLAVAEGREHDLRAILDPVLADRRWTDYQQVWFAGQFVTGRIDEAAFRAQPMGRWVDYRLALLRGIAADCRGEREAALAGYRACLALPFWVRRSHLLEAAYIELRIAALGG